VMSNSGELVKCKMLNIRVLNTSESVTTLYSGEISSTALRSVTSFWYENRPDEPRLQFDGMFEKVGGQIHSYEAVLSNHSLATLIKFVSRDSVPLFPSSSELLCTYLFPEHLIDELAKTRLDSKFLRHHRELKAAFQLNSKN